MYNVEDMLTELKTYHGHHEVKVAVEIEVRGETEIQLVPIKQLKFEDDEVIIELD